jgi:hypothetical protein
MQVKPLSISPYPLAMDAEFQGRGSLAAFSREYARVALKAAEDLGQPQTAGFEIAERRRCLSFRPRPGRDLALSGPIDRGNGRDGTKGRKRRQHGCERIGRHPRVRIIGLI